TIKSAHPSRVEVTLHLDAPVAWNHFSLPASKGKPARIVLDVAPAANVPTSVTAMADSETPAIADTETAALLAAPSTRAARGRPLGGALAAGHGGPHPGPVALSGPPEKKPTLVLAQRGADDLNRRSGIRAVLTRDDDTYLTLPERNEVAEKKGADIFVSIHLNSAPSASARGAEIYFVAPAGAERAANNVLESGDAAHEFGLDGKGDADIVHLPLGVNQPTVLPRSGAPAAGLLGEGTRHR